MISGMLKTLQGWMSLFEVGCGSGANLINIVKHFDSVQLGGCDINADAIESGNKSLKGVHLKIGAGDDIMMSDNSVDVVLSDMMLIYVDPRKIDTYIKEMRRIGRKYIVLCEFHSRSWWRRLVLRWNSGYHAYNYKKLLEKHGFYDVVLTKVPEQLWPGGQPQKEYAFIIRATMPKRK